MAKVRLTRDALAAYVVLAPGERIAPDAAMALLDRAGVTYGLEPEAIARLSALEGPIEARVASGVSPVAGVDAVITYHFPTEPPALAPMIRPDGTADYRELGLIKNVEAGQVLARRTPPVPGRDGMTVKGHRLAARRPRDRVLRAGEHCRVTADGLAIVASEAGWARLDHLRVTVSRRYRVAGDVGLKTGHLDFDGDLEILGGVGPEMRVAATGTVTIHGNVSGGRVSAGGAVTIHGHAVRGAVLAAGGDLAVGFAEHAAIAAGGAVTVREDLVHCQVAARGAIAVGGSLVGGRAQSGVRVAARVLGSPLGVPTEVVVDAAGAWREAIAAIAAERRQAREQLALLSEAVHRARALSEAGRGPDAARWEALLTACRQLADHDEALADRERRLKETPAVALVEAREVIHPGVEAVVGAAAAAVAEPYWAGVPAAA